MTRIGKPEKKKNVFTRVVMPLVLLGAALVAGGYLLFRDIEPPHLAIGPEASVVAPGTVFPVVAADTKSGLESLVIEIRQEGQVRERFEKRFGERTPTHTESIHLNKELYADGPIEISAEAKDQSLYPFGGVTSSARTFVLDSVKPGIAVAAHALNINQGGAGLVAYTLDEEVQRTGIRSGTQFFPGYQQPGTDTWLCLFAMPHDTPPDEFKPQLTAMDLAGNERTATLHYHANARTFKSDRINLPLSFLTRKAELFTQYFPDDPETDPLGRYLKINTELRQKNRARLREIGLDTSPTLHLDGAFDRAPGSTTAGFGENRDYYYQGAVVDNQTHLGVDIASVKNAPIHAAGPGRVVVAEFYGIYGNCVVLDHGIGLQTLYSHLSEIAVQAGQEVARGELIGKSGVTGLAGGDHLHFGVLVSGVPVNPVEWWDPAWVRNNILSKIER
ncbi:MAG: M23 family metallopeptidase [Desulfovibrionaceae bacterium]